MIERRMFAFVLNLHACESRQGISSSYSSDKFVSFKVRQNERKKHFFASFSNLHSIASHGKAAESMFLQILFCLQQRMLISDHFYVQQEQQMSFIRHKS
jgi:putative flippase GtrA